MQAAVTIDGIRYPGDRVAITDIFVAVAAVKRAGRTRTVAFAAKGEGGGTTRCLVLVDASTSVAMEYYHVDADDPFFVKYPEENVSALIEEMHVGELFV